MVSEVYDPTVLLQCVGADRMVMKRNVSKDYVTVVHKAVVVVSTLITLQKVMVSA